MTALLDASCRDSCSNGRAEIVEILLSAGADVNHRNIVCDL